MPASDTTREFRSAYCTIWWAIPLHLSWQGGRSLHNDNQGDRTTTPEPSLCIWHAAMQVNEPVTRCSMHEQTLKPRTSMTKQQARRRSSSSGLGLSSPVPSSSNLRIADSCRLICSALTRPLSSATWRACMHSQIRLLYTESKAAHPHWMSGPVHLHSRLHSGALLPPSQILPQEVRDSVAPINLRYIKATAISAGGHLLVHSRVSDEHYRVFWNPMKRQEHLGHRAKRGKVGSQLLDSFQQPCSFCILAPLHRPLQLVCAHTAIYPESTHPLQPECVFSSASCLASCSSRLQAIP